MRSDDSSAPDAPPLLFVIEDDEAIRKLLIQTLEDDGHRVSSANDGETALDLLQELAPCLIVVDFRLPGMDGFEFVTRYRESHRSPAEVLLLSASPPPEEMPEGIVHYLRKPFDLDELSQVVGDLVQGRRVEL